jgi:glycosyltransferase 2 family protein
MKHFLSFSLKLLITAGILWYIVAKLGWEHIVSTVASANVWWLVATAAVFLFSNCIGAFQWKILLYNKGIDISYWRGMIVYFIGMFFSNFLFGMIAADAVRITYLKIDGGKGKSGFAATFLDRFAGLMAILGFAVIGSIMLLKQKTLESNSLSLALIALLVTFGLLFGLFLLIVSSRLQKVFFLIIHNSPLPMKKRIISVASEVILETHDRHVILPVAVLSVIIQFLRIGGNISCAVALGLLTSGNLGSIHYFFIFVPMLAILMLIPLPFGVREGIGGTLFMLAGFNREAAFIMGFLTSIVGIAVTLPGGLFFLAKQRSMISDESVTGHSAEK